MNFIVVGVIAPIAYFLLRMFVKRLVQNFILNAKKIVRLQKCKSVKSVDNVISANKALKPKALKP